MDALVANFIDVVKTNEPEGDDAIREALTNHGWPMTAYGVSKLALSAYTRILSRDAHVIENGIAVNAMCPGWCKSDMAGWERPPRSAQEGECCCSVVGETVW